MQREHEGTYWPDGGDASSCVCDHACDCGITSILIPSYPCPTRQLHTGQFELIGDDVVEQQPEILCVELER